MNILELLQEAGVKVYEQGEHHHVSHGWIGLDCPYCGPNEARLGIPLSRPVLANCWACGAHSTRDVLFQLGGPQLARMLKKVNFDDPLPQVERRGTLKLPKGLWPIVNVPKAWNFIANKNVNPKKAASLWQVKCLRLAAKYGRSIFIPVTLDGEVVSFTTRGYEGHNDSYQMPSPAEEAIPAKDVLYGADLARNSIVIAEGPFDAMAVGIGGTSTLGLAYTRSQLLQMSRFKKRVVCFDAEPRAQQVARKLCDDLSVFSGDTWNVVLESGKDPSRADEHELKLLRSMIV